MTRVRYSGSAYHITGHNIVKNMQLDFKFDTGASSTLITLGAMLDDDIDEDRRNRIKTSFEKFEKYGIIKMVFRSASNTEMPVYKVSAEDVIIGNIHISMFSYWLSPMIENKKVLLGDDFIRYCKFDHDPEGDIIIRSFDSNGYEMLLNRTDKSKCLSLDEILETIEA